MSRVPSVLLGLPLLAAALLWSGCAVKPVGEAAGPAPDARRYFAFEPDPMGQVDLLFNHPDLYRLIGASPEQLSSIRSFGDLNLPPEYEQKLAEIRQTYRPDAKAAPLPPERKDRMFREVMGVYREWYLARARTILSQEQYQRLMMVVVQVYGPEMLVTLHDAMPPAGRLEFEPGQEDKLLDLIEDYHEERQPELKYLGRLIAAGLPRGKAEETTQARAQAQKHLDRLIELNRECDAAVWARLSPAQRNQVKTFIGPPLKLKWQLPRSLAALLDTKPPAAPAWGKP